MSGPKDSSHPSPVVGPQQFHSGIGPFFFIFFGGQKKEAKERPPSTWPSASLAGRMPAAVPQTRPDKSGLKQCGPFFPHASVARGCVERDKTK
jgi:hypothetical protein